MRRLTAERSLYGYPLRAEITLLDEGAVIVYENGHVQRQSYRDVEISRYWEEIT